MNIVIKILQVLLGLWNITGGIYMSMNYLDLINPWAANTLPAFFWIGLAVVQILLSLGLILSVFKKFEKLAPISAIGSAIIALLGTGLYVSYSGFPGMLWGVVPAVLLAFVAYWKTVKQ